MSDVPAENNAFEIVITPFVLSYWRLYGERSGDYIRAELEKLTRSMKNKLYQERSRSGVESLRVTQRNYEPSGSKAKRITRRLKKMSKASAVKRMKRE